MNTSIKYRLFLAFLTATCLVVFCMFLVMKGSFDRGFLRYINTMEQEQLEKLARGLEKAYAEHEGWDFLRQNPAELLRLIAATRPKRDTPSPHRKMLRDLLAGQEGRSPREQRPRIPRRFPRMFELRVLLLDARQQRVLGPSPPPRLVLQPLSCAGRTVGYLGLIKPRGIGDIIDHHQLRFAKEQRRSFALIAVLVAAGAALLSFPLSRRMVKRITTLAAATNQLAAGRYDIRVPVRTADELGRLSRDFNTLAQTLENNEQLRRRWMADISHELRTPLAVLRGEIEAVQDGVRQMTSHTLDQLHGEVLRFERLVTDLYELSLTDIGALQYRKAPIDLVEILQSALAAYRPRFSDRHLTLEDDLIPEQPAPLLGDPERLRQLFANLLENALRYTDAGGCLRIAVERTKDRIVLNFQDSAPGVPESALERLFDRLYRVEGSRSRAHGGAGLGLALCKNIVEAHEGAIAARPSPLGGLWITITFPLNG
jgi:two-component system sensor histidine kinase BaeS